MILGLPEALVLYIIFNCFSSCSKPFGETVFREFRCRYCIHWAVLIPFSIFSISKKHPLDNSFIKYIRKLYSRTVLEPSQSRLGRHLRPKIVPGRAETRFITDLELISHSFNQVFYQNLNLLTWFLTLTATAIRMLLIHIRCGRARVRFHSCSLQALCKGVERFNCFGKVYLPTFRVFPLILAASVA